MLEVTGNLWDYPANAVVVTTNGTISNGKNIMGGGSAREAADRYPRLPYMVADSLIASGNQVFHWWIDGKHILTMPTKDDVRENSKIDLIKTSAEQLVDHADGWKWDTVVLPRPGCGLGGLDWEEVKPVLEKILDDRFHVITFSES